MSNRQFESTFDLYIRATHPYAFRSGQWARVVQVGYLPEKYGSHPRPGRPVYNIEFVDGVVDQWPIYDRDAEYEFYPHAGPLNKPEPPQESEEDNAPEVAIRGT